MTIKQIIQKAIEGGYYDNDIVKFKLNHEKKPSWIYFTHEENCSSKQPISKTFLSPYFWQALGKSLGWEDQHVALCNSITTCDDGWCNKVWKKKWHEFIDHLAKEKDYESFFKQF